MCNRDRKSPWNPASGLQLQISPEEYERQVVSWLRVAGRDLKDFCVTHSEKLSGASGEYEFDAIAEFQVFDGAQITVLIECKRHSSPIKREVLLALEAKLRDVGAHKAMVFSTAGFQKGALEYATERRIATITFVNGNLSFETRYIGSAVVPPPRAKVPRFAGNFLSARNNSVSSSLVLEDHLEPIREWLESDNK